MRVPIVGGADKDESVDVNNQKTVNWFLDVEKAGGRSRVQLLPMSGSDKAITYSPKIFEPVLCYVACDTTGYLPITNFYWNNAGVAISFDPGEDIPQLPFSDMKVSSKDYRDSAIGYFPNSRLYERPTVAYESGEAIEFGELKGYQIHSPHSDSTDEVWAESDLVSLSGRHSEEFTVVESPVRDTGVRGLHELNGRIAAVIENRLILFYPEGNPEFNAGAYHSVFNPTGTAVLEVRIENSEGAVVLAMPVNLEKTGSSYTPGPTGVTMSGSSYFTVLVTSSSASGIDIRVDYNAFALIEETPYISGSVNFFGITPEELLNQVVYEDLVNDIKLIIEPKYGDLSSMISGRPLLDTDNPYKQVMQFYDADVFLNTLIAGSGPVSIESNGNALMIATNTGSAYLLDLVSGEFGEVTTPGFSGAISVCQINRFFAYVEPKSSRFWASDLDLTLDMVDVFETVKSYWVDPITKEIFLYNYSGESDTFSLGDIPSAANATGFTGGVINSSSSYTHMYAMDAEFYDDTYFFTPGDKSYASGDFSIKLGTVYADIVDDVYTPGGGIGYLTWVGPEFETDSNYEESGPGVCKVSTLAVSRYSGLNSKVPAPVIMRAFKDSGDVVHHEHKVNKSFWANYGDIVGGLVTAVPDEGVAAFYNPHVSGRTEAVVVPPGATFSFGSIIKCNEMETVFLGNPKPPDYPKAYFRYIGDVSYTNADSEPFQLLFYYMVGFPNPVYYYDHDNDTFVLNSDDWERVPGTTLSGDVLSFATAEGDPSDQLTAIKASRGYLYLFGTRSIELWYTSGDIDFPFARVESGVIPYGVEARDSIAVRNDIIAFLSSDNRVMILSGSSPQVISTPDMVKRMSKYINPDKAVGMIYTDRGYTFYQLTFFDEGITWVYQFETGEWLNRESYGWGGAHFAMSSVQLGEDIYFGVVSGGTIYLSNSDSYTDDGRPIVRERQTQFISVENSRILLHSLELLMETGSAPLEYGEAKVEISFSDDGGRTWSSPRERSLGSVGEYAKRIMVRRLGMFRNRVLKIVVSDPVRTSIIDGYADMTRGKG